VRQHSAQIAAPLPIQRKKRIDEDNSRQLSLYTDAGLLGERGRAGRSAGQLPFTGAIYQFAIDERLEVHLGAPISNFSPAWALQSVAGAR
jgi:hypothetical protein